VERNADDETTDYIVGPRGHAEIGKRGIQRFVEAVYGERAPEDLAKRLHRSLGVATAGSKDEEDEEEEQPDNGEPGPSTQRRSGRQVRGVVDD